MATPLLQFRTHTRGEQSNCHPLLGDIGAAWLADRVLLMQKPLVGACHPCKPNVGPPGTLLK